MSKKSTTTHTVFAPEGVRTFGPVGTPGRNPRGHPIFSSDVAFILSRIVGYLMQDRDGRFNFRAALSSYVLGTGAGVTNGGFMPMPYVSFGTSF